MLIGHVRDRVNDNSNVLTDLVNWGHPTATRLRFICDVFVFPPCKMQSTVATTYQSGVSRTSAHPPLTHATRDHCMQLTPMQAARNTKHATLHPLQTAPAAEACAWHAFQTSVYTQRLQTEMHRNGASYDPAQHWKGHPQYNHPMRLPFCKRTK